MLWLRVCMAACMYVLIHGNAKCNLINLRLLVGCAARIAGHWGTIQTAALAGSEVQRSQSAIVCRQKSIDVMVEFPLIVT